LQRLEMRTTCRIYESEFRRWRGSNR
jgi:hypothetical protein